MQSALNWCISACRCPWQWTQGSSNYTDLDLAADSGRLDRRALLEDNGLARSSSTASSPDTRRYQPRRPACEGISYGSAVLEEGDAGAASNSLEAFVPANEVPPVVENGGEEAGRRRRPLIEHNEGTIPLVNHIAMFSLRRSHQMKVMQQKRQQQQPLLQGKAAGDDDDVGRTEHNEDHDSTDSTLLGFWYFNSRCPSLRPPMSYIPEDSGVSFFD
ncbi:hypothetical protein FOL46_005252, partial [Perkinsus olseni]